MARERRWTTAPGIHPAYGLPDFRALRTTRRGSERTLKTSSLTTRNEHSGGPPMSEARLAASERRLHLLIVLNIAILVAIASATCRTTAANDRKPQVLTVAEVDIVDAHGVIRPRLGADWPAAALNGKRVPRQQKPSGLLLYDDTGQERGG